jgi:glycine/D-amino acid oxidase-like deaminating enzyme
MSNRYGFDYWQQLPDGRIALGGGRDRAMDEEWTADATPTPRIQAYLDSLLRDRLRVTAAVTHRWAAIVSYTTTGLPVVGEVRPGVWVAGGYSGTGNLMGALSGRAIVRAAFDEPSPYDVLLSPLLQGRP